LLPVRPVTASHRGGVRYSRIDVSASSLSERESRSPLH